MERGREGEQESGMESSSPFRENILKGKVALLTGGGSGIGYEISYQLGKHGASIAIMGRRRDVIDAAVSSLQSLGIQVICLFTSPHTFDSAFVLEQISKRDGCFLGSAGDWVCW